MKFLTFLFILLFSLNAQSNRFFQAGVGLGVISTTSKILTPKALIAYQNKKNLYRITFSGNAGFFDMNKLKTERLNTLSLSYGRSFFYKDNFYTFGLNFNDGVVPSSESTIFNKVKDIKLNGMGLQFGYTRTKNWEAYHFYSEASAKYAYISEYSVFMFSFSIGYMKAFGEKSQTPLPWSE